MNPYATEVMKGQGIDLTTHHSKSVDGFTLSFAADPKLRERVARWAKCEGRCCPFFSFHLTDLPGSFAVEISGPDGAKEILRGVLEEHAVKGEA